MPRPLAELLHKTLGETFARQGFASTELVTRWAGHRRARRSPPIRSRRKSSGRGARTATRRAGDAGAAGRRADGDRNPAPVRRHPRTRQPLLRLAGGRRLRLRQAPLAAASASRAPAPIRQPRRASRQALPEIADEDLRHALARLGAAIKQRDAREVLARRRAIATIGDFRIATRRRPVRCTDYDRMAWTRYRKLARPHAPQFADRGRRGRRSSRPRAAAITSGAGPSTGRAAAVRPARCLERRTDDAGPARRQVLGAANAPVTIIEYASMTCPHCATFHETTYPEMKKQYIDTGKVRFIFREFPLDPLAAAGSMLARCAGKDKYFALIETLFAQQKDWVIQKPLAAAARDRQAGRLHPAELRRVPGESAGAQRHRGGAAAGDAEAQRQVDADLLHQRQALPGLPAIEELDKEMAPYLKG